MTKWLLGLMLVYAAANSSLAMPRPPSNAVKLHHGDGDYFGGMVYLSSQDDTVKLKGLGFRSLAFDSRSFSSFKYHSEWPQSAVDQPLPAYVNVGSDQSLTPQAQRFAGGPGNRYSVGDRSFGGTSLESRRSVLQSMTDVIHCHARPGNGKPDLVIDGRAYVRGYVTLRSLADTVDLAPFGFFGFDPESKGGLTWDYSFVGLGVISYSAYHAWWPMDVPVKLLPQSVYGIQADRMRRGTGEVVIERKMPVE
jgi:hypothetical protein